MSSNKFANRVSLHRISIVLGQAFTTISVPTKLCKLAASPYKPSTAEAQHFGILSFLSVDPSSDS
jgi:hypothetical protein